MTVLMVLSLAMSVTSLVVVVVCLRIFLSLHRSVGKLYDNSHRQMLATILAQKVDMPGVTATAIKEMLKDQESVKLQPQKFQKGGVSLKSSDDVGVTLQAELGL